MTDNPYPDEFPFVQNLDDMLDQMTPAASSTESPVPGEDDTVGWQELFAVPDAPEFDPRSGYGAVPPTVSQTISQTAIASSGCLASTASDGAVDQWRAVLIRWTRGLLWGTWSWIALSTVALVVNQTRVSLLGAVALAVMLMLHAGFIMADNRRTVGGALTRYDRDTWYNAGTERLLSHTQNRAMTDESLLVRITTALLFVLGIIIVHNLTHSLHGYPMSGIVTISWLSHLSLPVTMGTVSLAHLVLVYWRNYRLMLSDKKF